MRAERVDEVLVADHEADAPARHVVALRHREELDRDVARAFDLHDRRRLPAVERDVRIREIVHDVDAVLAGERDDLLEERQLDALRRRIRREVDDEHLRLRKAHLDRLLELGEEIDVRASSGPGGCRRPRSPGRRCGSDSSGSARARCRRGPAWRAPDARCPPSSRSSRSLPSRDRTRRPSASGTSGRSRGAAAGCPSTPSSRAYRRAAPSRRACRTMCCGVGPSGLPMPKSMMSSPRRRAAILSSVVIEKTYGGRRVRRANCVSGDGMRRSF